MLADLDFELLGNLLVRFRAPDQILDVKTGDELGLRAGFAWLPERASLAVPRRIFLEAEGESALRGDFAAGTVPAEWRLGASFCAARAVSLDLGGGTALGDGIGAPKARFIFGVGYAPEACGKRCKAAIASSAARIPASSGRLSRDRRRARKTWSSDGNRLVRMQTISPAAAPAAVASVSTRRAGTTSLHLSAILRTTPTLRPRPKWPFQRRAPAAPAPVTSRVHRRHAGTPAAGRKRRPPSRPAGARAARPRSASFAAAARAGSVAGSGDQTPTAGKLRAGDRRRACRFPMIAAPAAAAPASASEPRRRRRCRSRRWSRSTICRTSPVRLARAARMIATATASKTASTPAPISPGR